MLAVRVQKAADVSWKNWIKAKTCLSGIKTAVSTQLMMLPTFPGGKELKGTLVIPAEDFEYRWEAD